MSAAIEARIWRYLHKHFGCLSLCDLRLSMAQRDSMAREVESKRECCTMYGLHRGIKALTARPSADEQVQAIMQLSHVLSLLAWFLRLSIACVERLHLLHRLASSGGTATLDMLSANALCMRAKREFESWRAQRAERQEQFKQGLRSDAETSVKDGIDFQSTLRAHSPSEVFKKRRFAQEAALGNRVNPTTMHQQIAAEWASASAEERAICSQISAASAETARINRVAAKRKVAVPLLAENVPLGEQAEVVADAATRYGLEPLEDGNASPPGKEPAVPLHVAPYDRHVAEATVVSGVLQPDALAPQVGTEPTAPWTSSLLEDYRQGSGFFVDTGRKDKEQIEIDWVASCQETGRAESFPDMISYPTACGTLCRTMSPQCRLDFQRELCQALSKLVKD